MKQTVNNVLRNRNCVINHLPLAKKVRIINKLCINNLYPQWAETRQMQEDVQGNRIAVTQALSFVSSVSDIEMSELEKDLFFCYQTGLLECHMTDLCNLKCVNCYYGEKEKVAIPFDRLAEYIEALHP